MTDVIKIKLAVIITLVLQTASMFYLFGSFKARTEGEILHAQQMIREIRDEQKRRTFLVYKVEELIHKVERLETKFEQRRHNP